MDWEEFLEGAATRQRAVLERLRRFGLRPAGAPVGRREPPSLADVHREHVAALLTTLLAARVEDREPPAEVSLDALARLGSAVERWGLAAEVALLATAPSAANDRRLGDAVLRLSPTPARRALVDRLGPDAGDAPT